MEFSPLFKSSLPSGAVPSTTGRFIASLTQTPPRLVIRSADSLAVKRVIALPAELATKAHTIKWAPPHVILAEDGAEEGDERLLVADEKTVKVYGVHDEAFEANITEGIGGVRGVDWDRTGDNILIFSDFQLKLTVWSLSASAGAIIYHPKFPNKGHAYRPGSPYLALMTRTPTAHDAVSLFDTSMSPWRLARTWRLPTVDAQGLQWSSCGQWLAVWDSSVEYSIHIYTVDGRSLKSYSAYRTGSEGAPGLGIKTVSWKGDFLALGSYDGKVRLLNQWFTPVLELTHSSTIRCGAKVWREIAAAPAMGVTPGYEIASQPCCPPTFNVTGTGADVVGKLGVGVCMFNADGTLLATRTDHMPTTLWIWDLRILAPIAILVQRAPIRSVQWNPTKRGLLAIICAGTEDDKGRTRKGGPDVSLWSEEWETPRVVRVPVEGGGFEVGWCRWVDDVVPEEEVEEGRKTSVLIGNREVWTMGRILEEDDVDGEAAEDQGPVESKDSGVSGVSDGKVGEESLSEILGLKKDGIEVQA
ncbi:hypothetical protein SAICODRAFT_69933 [Saitoella complicata NRRL Y-17804]|uniref:uncharacterized protein n=1 Tax=Saitoella complicata (strain BCRC 22490 / CBS 7301 / JCM 7358 / NBRC 10748 / NRRL Y-17804) TaxID=698492 RepID=UPI0008675721|nr:uncharacterized protein SAICODRAFT_69933 [Saitoella complicata NRRL Y-17804]ODQ54748.1 hypothetical protein SAICODRAFT_69933 [Saitoella complicata NRRL Y-17804]